jgi:hypothetical protein
VSKVVFKVNKNKTMDASHIHHAKNRLTAVDIQDRFVGIWFVLLEAVPLDTVWFMLLEAICWKAANEMLLPFGPGFIANTMPLPQWLAAVSAAWRQWIQMGPD